MFCGERLLVSYLRSSNIDAAKHALRILRLLVKALRYVVSNLAGEPRAVYDELYCARGEMENRIKEQQLGLFSDRTSCHAWWANQLRLLLSSCAYVLCEALRRIGLQGTELARAQVSTIRLKLFKIGVVILRNTRRIQLRFSSAYPLQELFSSVFARLAG